MPVIPQQFPNDQMRVQLVKESRGHTIETLNAQVIEAAAATANAGKVADRMATPATGVIISAPRPLRPLLA